MRSNRAKELSTSSGRWWLIKHRRKALERVSREDKEQSVKQLVLFVLHTDCLSDNNRRPALTAPRGVR